MLCPSRFELLVNARSIKTLPDSAYSREPEACLNTGKLGKALLFAPTFCVRSCNVLTTFMHPGLNNMNIILTRCMCSAKISLAKIGFVYNLTIYLIC